MWNSPVTKLVLNKTAMIGTRGQIIIAIYFCILLLQSLSRFQMHISTRHTYNCGNYYGRMGYLDAAALPFRWCDYIMTHVYALNMNPSGIALRPGASNINCIAGNWSLCNFMQIIMSSKRFLSFFFCFGLLYCQLELHLHSFSKNFLKYSTLYVVENACYFFPFSYLQQKTKLQIF